MSALTEAIDGAIAELAEPTETATEPVTDVTEGIVDPSDPAFAPVEGQTEEEVVPSEPEPEPEDKLPATVPYDRFAEVVHQRQRLEELLEQAITGPKPSTEPEPEHEPTVEEESILTTLLGADWTPDSDGEAGLAKAVAHIEKTIKSELSAVRAENADLKQQLTGITEKEVLAEVNRQFDAAKIKLGIQLSAEDEVKFVEEVGKYAPMGVSIEEATTRAFHFMKATNQITPIEPAKPETPKSDPLRSVKDAKSRVAGNAPASSPTPTQPQALEEMTDLQEIIAFAVKQEAAGAG